jgi:photosystem II stability/assembly factor-like uncharacterized protein
MFKFLILIFTFLISSVSYAEYINPDEPNMTTLDSVDTYYPVGDNSTPLAYIYDIAVLDSMNYVYLTGSGFVTHLDKYYMVRATTDGGETWSTILKDRRENYMSGIPMQKIPRRIFYPKKDFVILFCDSGYVRLTSNMGKDWEYVSIDSTRPFGMYITTGLSNSMIDSYMIDSVGLYRFSFTYNYITEDYGYTWKKVNHNASKVSNMQLVTEDILIARTLSEFSDGSKAIWDYSTNRGKNWTLILDEPKEIDNKRRVFQFINQHNGYFYHSFAIDTINYTQFYRTTDGGKTWEIFSEIFAETGSDSGVPRMIVYDENTILLYQYSACWLTVDGGKAWSRHPITYDEFLSSYNYIFAARMINSLQILIGAGPKLILLDLNKTSFVEDRPVRNSVSLYPNPTRDILHIRTDELIARAELSDVLGNVVISDLTPTLSKGEGVSLNVESLPAGMYFLKLYTLSGEVLVEKVLVGF